MATPQPPLTPDQRVALEQKQKFERLARNIAIGGLILCPTIALLPPRKLDLYTFSLAIGFYLSADYLCEANYGHGVLEHIAPRRWTVVNGLPTEKAREIQKKNDEQRAKAREAMTEGREEKDHRGILGRVWMGNEKEGWKERRIEEEKQALEEGRSYGSLILEQVWDVWNSDKKKDDESEDAKTSSAKDESKKS